MRPSPLPPAISSRTMNRRADNEAEVCHQGGLLSARMLNDTTGARRRHVVRGPSPFAGELIFESTRGKLRRDAIRRKTKLIDVATRACREGRVVARAGRARRRFARRPWQ